MYNEDLDQSTRNMQGPFSEQSKEYTRHSLNPGSTCCQNGKYHSAMPLMPCVLPMFSLLSNTDGGFLKVFVSACDSVVNQNFGSGGGS